MTSGLRWRNPVWPDFLINSKPFGADRRNACAPLTGSEGTTQRWASRPNCQYRLPMRQFLLLIVVSVHQFDLKLSPFLHCHPISLHCNWEQYKMLFPWTLPREKGSRDEMGHTKRYQNNMDPTQSGFSFKCLKNKTTKQWRSIMLFYIQQKLWFF